MTKKNLQLELLKYDRGFDRRIAAMCPNPALLRDKLVVGYGAFSEGTPVGMIAAKVDSWGMEIINVYVIPEYREKGVAKTLYENLTGFIETRVQSKADVILRASFGDDGTGALYRFFSALEFELFKSSPYYSVPLSLFEARGSMFPATMKKVSTERARAFTALPEAEIRQLSAKRNLEITDRDLCFACVDKRGRIVAYLVAHRLSEDATELSLVENIGTRMTDPLALFKSLYEALKKQEVGKDHKINFLATNPKIVSFVQVLLGKKQLPAAEADSYFAVKIV